MTIGWTPSACIVLYKRRAPLRAHQEPLRDFPAWPPREHRSELSARSSHPSSQPAGAQAELRGAVTVLSDRER
jgi:hypothetical protein